MCCPSSGWCRGRSCYFIIASLHRSPSLVLPLFISHSCYVISLSSVYRCRRSICVIAALFPVSVSSVVELLFLLWNIVQIALSPQLISPGRKKSSSSIAPLESCGSRSSSLISNDHKNIIKFRVVNERKNCIFTLLLVELRSTRVEQVINWKKSLSSAPRSRTM